MAFAIIKIEHKKNEQFHLSLKKLFFLVWIIPPIIRDGNKNTIEINRDEHKKNIPIKKKMYPIFSKFIFLTNENW